MTASYQPGQVLTAAELNASLNGKVDAADAQITGGQIQGVDFVQISGTTDSTSTATGALTVAGGAGIGGNLYVGESVTAAGPVIANSPTQSTSPTTGAVIAVGGAGVGGNLNVGGSANVAGSVSAQVLDATATTDSTSTTTGAVIVSGGVGIAKSVNIGGGITIAGAATHNGGTSTANLTLQTGGKVTFADGTTQSTAGAINGELTITAASGTTTITAAQAAANSIFKVSGALTGNMTLAFPAAPKNFTVQNNTTGSYTLTVIATGQTPSAGVLQGTSSSLFTDATGCYATSSAGGIGFASEFPDTTGLTLSLTHLGALVLQNTVGITTKLPVASTYPAGKGVTVQCTVSSATIAKQGTDTMDAPGPMVQGDTYFMVSDGVSKWAVGWYSNKVQPSYNTSISAPKLLAGQADNGTDAIQANGSIGATGAGGILRAIGAAAASAAQLISTALGLNISALGNNAINFLTNGVVRGLVNGAGRWLLGTSTDDGASILQVGGVVSSQSGGFMFPDGTTQTTANGVTAPASQTYVQGTTDTVGQFAIGDTSLRTSGFNAPFVEVKRGGLWLTRGKHYTLNADGIHLNGFDPFTVDDTDVEVLTKVIHSPATAYSPAFAPLTVAAGATTIPYAHVQGFAPLMNNGAWLTPGTDYTEDANNYYLTVPAGTNDSYAAWNLTPITLANMLSKVNPAIGSGPLTFADGSVQNTAPLSNRNYIVDGNFDSWVAASASGSGFIGGAATMYYGYAGGGAATVSQNSWSPGLEPAGLTTPTTYYLKHNQTTAGSGAALVQRIESVRTLEGRSATFSCWLWTDSGSITIPFVSIQQNFGTGGSPSSAVTVNTSVNWVVTTTPQRFSVRLDVPSISGKALGTSGNDYLQTYITLPNSTLTVNTAQWQLEKSSPQSSSDINGAGGSPTPFEYRGQQAELARVQRYYYSQIGTHTLTAVSPFSGYGQYFNFSWPQQMRANPAVTPTWAGGSGVSGEAINNISQSGVDLTVTTNLGANSNFYIGLTGLVADARL